MLVSALPFPSSSPSSFPTLLHLCLLSVASSKDALSISGTTGVNLVEEQGQEGKRGKVGRRKEGGEHLTRRQKDNFGRAALFKVEA